MAEQAQVPGQSVASTGAWWVRWAILFLSCAGLFGQFYAYDNPSALNKQLQVHCAATSTSSSTEAEYDYNFNLLYSVYSVPNLLLPIILGVCIDKMGVRIIISVLATCVIVGQVIVAVGTESCNWSLMWTGRALFGAGGESIQIAQIVLLFRWFKGKEVALALGLIVGVARGGSVLNDVLSPWTAEHYGLVEAFWLGVALCAVSAACNIASVMIDYRAAPNVRNEDQTDLRDAINLPRLFWLLAAFGVVIYSAIVPFNSVASAFFVENFYASLPLAAGQQHAGNVMSLMFLVSAFGAPVVGGIVDRIGQRTHMLVFASVLMSGTFAVLLSAPPVITMVSLGIVYTIFAAALWPTVILAVPERKLGTAYGLATALQNGGLAVTPLIVAYLQASKSHYLGVAHLFFFLGILGTVFALAIQVEARRTGVRLDLPTMQQAVVDDGTLQEKDRLIEAKQGITSQSSQHIPQSYEPCDAMPRARRVK